MNLNPLIDLYLKEGCMRCPYGATDRCKVIPWREELQTLRQIALESGLQEEKKWGVPVYTLNGKNVISVNALKESANLSFFKGALLRDENGLLQQQGSIQSGRIIKFTSVEEIVRLQSVLANYIQEAIQIEQSGAKVMTIKNPEPIPDELLDAFQEDSILESAFYALTPGRQRAYIITFSQPKQTATRKNRIQKYRDQIVAGIGLHDEYKKNQ